MFLVLELLFKNKWKHVIQFKRPLRTSSVQTGIAELPLIPKDV